ncbi:MAG: Hsp20/alpha crystallin family protein [Desulfobacteraceae bacterium]|nr:Hsp20/alpha crystallin family protein [Desulfobacteraceae bacterium]
MGHIKINFSKEVDDFGSQIGKTIQDIFRPRPVNPMFASKDCNWVPQMDIFETANQITVWAELAGVEKDDLVVEVNSKAVQLSGYRKQIKPMSAGTYRLAEIRYGRFERVLYLPSPVNIDAVDSFFANGLLTIRMEKIALKKSHKIPISDG